MYSAEYGTYFAHVLLYAEEVDACGKKSDTAMAKLQLGISLYLYFIEKIRFRLIKKS